MSAAPLSQEAAQVEGARFNLAPGTLDRASVSAAFRTPPRGSICATPIPRIQPETIRLHRRCISQTIKQPHPARSNSK